MNWFETQQNMQRTSSEVVFLLSTKSIKRKQHRVKKKKAKMNSTTTNIPYCSSNGAHAKKIICFSVCLFPCICKCIFFQQLFMSVEVPLKKKINQINWKSVIVSWKNYPLNYMYFHTALHETNWSQLLWIILNHTSTLNYHSTQHPTPDNVNHCF